MRRRPLLALAIAAAAGLAWGVLSSDEEPWPGPGAKGPAAAAEAMGAAEPGGADADLAAPLDAALSVAPAAAVADRPVEPLTGICPRSPGRLTDELRTVLRGVDSSATASDGARQLARRVLAAPQRDWLPMLEGASASERADWRISLATAAAQVAAFEYVRADALLAQLLGERPQEPALQAMIPSVHESAQMGAPRRFERAGVQLVWFGPFPGEERALRVLDAAVDAAYSAASTTGGSAPIPLDVVVYPNAASLQRSLCRPAWLGGFYDGTAVHMPRLDPPPPDEPLEISTPTLRHEIMHAAIRRVASNVPAWLHEGMATQFARPGKVTRQHALLRAKMMNGRTCIPFASLEDSLVEIGDDASASLAYAQSMAMVQFMIHGGGPGAPERVLRYLARGGDPQRALAEGMGRSQVTESDFLDWLYRLMHP